MKNKNGNLAEHVLGFGLVLQSANGLTNVELQTKG
jgi:hypothetical protein